MARFKAAIASVQQSPLLARYGLQPPAGPSAAGPAALADISQAAQQALHAVQQQMKEDPNNDADQGVILAF